MEIQVTVKNNYGRDVFYPICETGRQIARLQGRKTLTSDDLALIKLLGGTIRLVHAEVVL